MEIFLSILYLVLGLILILRGAHYLTEGATVFAQKLNVSNLVIGLTVVAFGTSMPEFVISTVASLRGNSELSIGNIVGSNIFNVLAIVGITALIKPIVISKMTLTKDIPLGVLSGLVLLIMCNDSWFTHQEKVNIISRDDGLILIGFFIIFMAYTLYTAKHSPVVQDEDVSTPKMGGLKITLYIVGGLAALIGGGQIFVNGASDIARFLGMSEAVIGLTIVAGGTSLPELATSIVAARKGNSEMAIGNVVGSCLFNVFWVLGVCAVIRPMVVGDVSNIDLLTMFGSLILLWLFSYSHRVVSRWEGGVFTLLLIAYVGYQIIYV